MREQPAIIGELNFGYDVEGARLEGEPPPRAGVERRHGSENRTSEAIRATGIRMMGASMTRRRPAEGFRGGGSKGKRRDNRNMAVSAPRNQHRPDSSDLMIERIGRRPILQVILGLVVFIVAEGLGALLAQMIGGDTGTGVGGVIGALLAIGGYLLLMRFIAERSPLEFARRGALCELGAGVLIGTALMCAVAGAAALAGAYRVVGFNARAALFGFAGLSIMAGVAEEILFRGLLLRILEHRIGTWWALGLTSVLFGGVHFINPEATLMGAVAIALEAGLLLGACFILTRRLWLVIGVHAAWNFVQGGVFSSDVSGTGSGGIGLLSASIDGPAALTGGDMGFEGSLSAVVVCLACAIIVLLLARRRGLILPGMRKRSS